MKLLKVTAKELDLRIKHEEFDQIYRLLSRWHKTYASGNMNRMWRTMRQIIINHNQRFERNYLEGRRSVSHKIRVDLDVGE